MSRGSVLPVGGVGFLPAGNPLAPFEERIARFAARASAAEERGLARAGAVAGAAQGDAGDVRTIGGDGAYAQAFDRAVLESYGNRVRIAARERLDALASEHAGDPAAFERAARAYSDGLAQTMPAEARTPFVQQFDTALLPYLNRARDQLDRRVADERMASFLDGQTQRLSAIDRYGRSAAADPAARAALDLELATAREQLLALGPREAFTFGGVAYAADPTRAGARTLAQIQEALGSLDARATEAVALGAWDAGPRTRAWIDAFEARERGPGGSGLTAEQTDRLVSRMRRDLTEREQLAAIGRADLRARVADVEAALSDGRDADWSADEILRTLGPKEGARKVADLRRAAAFGRDAVAVRWATPEDLAAMRARREAEMAEVPDGYRELAQGTAALDRMIAARARALAEDPAAYVAQAPAVQRLSALAATADDAGRPAATQAWIEGMLAEQARLGVPAERRRALPRAQAEQTVLSLQAAGPQEAGGRLAALAGEYGRHWPRTYADLVRHGLAPEFQALAVVPPGPARTDMAAALQQPKDALRQAAGPDATEIDRKVRDAFGDLYASQALFPDGQEQAARFEDAARRLAYRYASGGAGATDAATRAAAAIVGRYDFVRTGDRDLVARAPKGQGAEVRAFARRLTEGLRADDLMDPADDPRLPPDLRPASALTADQRPTSALTPDQRRAVMLDAVRRGSWTTTETDDGWDLVGANGTRILRRDGRPIAFAFAEAAAAPPARARDAERSQVERDRMDQIRGEIRARDDRWRMEDPP